MPQNPNRPHIFIPPTIVINDQVAGDVNDRIQGHYALLSNFYFTGGLATETTIVIDDVDTWLDVLLTVDAAGNFDYRPDAMKNASAVGHSGTGALDDPITFKLEGLTQTASATLRAVLSFNPDEDGARLETRLNFSRHTGTTPSSNFTIEGDSLIMESGAEDIYAASPSTQFFIGDTIDTNGVGDAGTVRFQIKTDSPGIITMKELALFIQG